MVRRKPVKEPEPFDFEALDAEGDVYVALFAASLSGHIATGEDVDMEAVADKADEAFAKLEERLSDDDEDEDD